MEKILSIMVLVTADSVIDGKPTHSGYFKYHPISVKEELKPKTFGGLFAKIPQESSQDATFRKTYFSEVYFPHYSELGGACTNQVANVVTQDSRDISDSKSGNYIKLPIMSQPYTDYKIVVATAPWDVRITGEDAKPAVVYIVFPEDDESKAINVPTIYFVRKSDVPSEVHKKDKVEPVIIIDSNRTVTGLKSKEVAKFVKFKNKLANRVDYEVTR